MKTWISKIICNKPCFSVGASVSQPSKETRAILFIIAIALILMLSGCAKRQESISFKEIYVPVKCEVSLPSKPKFNPGDPQSARELASYYAQVEALLKGCVGDE